MIGLFVQPWVVWSCRLRSLIYVSFLSIFFYVLLPTVILNITNGWSAPPLFQLNDWRILTASILPPIMLGAWATLKFTDEGHGTPFPLDPPQKLITSGPFAFVRNPMQITGISLGVVRAMIHPTLTMWLYVVGLGMLAVFVFRPYEYIQMLRLFGEEYREYHQNVPNWAPRFRPYRGPIT